MRTLQKIFAITLAMMLFSTSLFALDLAQAKSQGLVGERYTGYIGAVQPSSSVNALVNNINAQRKTHYQQISTSNGTTLNVVETLAGAKLIERTPAGQYVDVGSGWQRK